MRVFVSLLMFPVFCLACGGGKSDNDTKSCPDSLPAPSVVFAKGADISWVTELEVKGISFIMRLASNVNVQP